MNPDYGLYVLENKLVSNLTVGKYYFYDMIFYGINILSPTDFTICLNTCIDEQTFAVSLDFDKAILESALSQLPKWHADSIRGHIKDVMSVGQSAVDFTNSFVASCECHIGTLQLSVQEAFVPFIIDSIEVKNGMDI
ncbi:hypothetical protein CCZ01_05885 [Helicobacter monodelphidis]|uniref:hypothetical protein n=1 Tax=Helicobacter sp. 15-1451 TaxID=2004995 RepID=UPI000DCCFC7B|nr:hypothetical protein [Helicobacter sp. 15-1451]RAX57510.1 hypothetical protein CCZ01_05885 [Helicobacter sp. 15-1451]